jgi:hypothetical protein
MTDAIRHALALEPLLPPREAKMKIIAAALLSGTLSCLAALSVSADDSKDWVDIKNPQELRALYSNKTFKGKDYLDRPFIGHYRADGQGIMIGAQGRVPRSWEVKGNDQVCVKLPWESPCYRFLRHTSKPGLYRAINVANDQVTELSVEDGVPNF